MIQSISGLVAEFKWCVFWASACIFAVVGRSLHKATQNAGTGGTIFLVQVAHSPCSNDADGRHTRARLLILQATAQFSGVRPHEIVANMSPVDETLLASFKVVLNSPPPAGRQKEQVVQDFLEQNTSLIPTPNLLNHHLHFEAVVSKFPLGTELTTDYVYITKSSDTWRITLVELESPDKKIFNADTRFVNTSAEFNAALNQVRSWKHFLSENRSEVIRRLEPLLQPIVMRRNPIEFDFQLIIGRSADKNLTPERKQHFRGLIDETGVSLMTFDQLISTYRSHQRYEKLVLRLTGMQYAFKYMTFEPTQLLSDIGPDRLTLTAEETSRLRTAGYEIDKWATGDLLKWNVKFAESTWKGGLKAGTLSPTD